MQEVKKCQVRWLLKVERVAAAALSQEHFVCLTAQSWLPAPLGSYLSKWKGAHEIVGSQSPGTITSLVWYTYCILVCFSFQQGALFHDLTIGVTDACVRVLYVSSENVWKGAGMHNLLPPFYFFSVHFINAFCAQHAYEVKPLISLPPAVFKHFLLAVAVIAQDVH